jgi:hypothetical protein
MLNPFPNPRLPETNPLLILTDLLTPRRLAFGWPKAFRLRTFSPSSKSAAASIFRHDLPVTMRSKFYSPHGTGLTPTSNRKSRTERSSTMPLLDIVQTRYINATIRLSQKTAEQIDQYAALVHASADEVVDKALAYVLAKDRDFQEFLQTPEAGRVEQSLRVRRATQDGTATEPVPQSAKRARSVETAIESRPRS